MKKVSLGRAGLWVVGVLAFAFSACRESVPPPVQVAVATTDGAVDGKTDSKPAAKPDAAASETAASSDAKVDVSAPASKDAAAAVEVGASEVTPAVDTRPVIADAPVDVAEATPMAPSCPVKPPEAECDPSSTEMLPLAAGRVRHCALDLGSTNVKLVVTSVTPGDPASLDGDRVCKKALRLRDKTQDPATMTNRPLLEADMNALVTELTRYKDLCSADKGTLRGAVATQWARNATNPEEIKAWFAAKMGLPLEILTGDEEGSFAYAAAANGGRERIILDAGGGSFQITYWPDADPKPTAASVAFGHEASAAKIWTRPEFKSYSAARDAYVAELRALIAAKPETAAAYARMGALLATQDLDNDLISLGDSGVILAVEGKLQDAAGRWVDEATYLQRMAERRRELALSMASGPKKVLALQDLKAFLAKLGSNDRWFEELREECVRKAYGAKVLGHLTLLAWIDQEYGLGGKVVFKSGEMAEGYLLGKLE